MTDVNTQRYTKSLETYIEQLKSEIETYQVVLAMQINFPEFYEQTKLVDESDY
jgi:hypothetical protein